MTTKADRLGAGNFGGPVSARRQAIANATAAATEGARPEKMKLSLISPNPDNPREELRDIESLMDTFRSVGQILAITLATVDAYLVGNPGRERDLVPGAQYVVIDGHRRLEAAQRLDWNDIKYTVDNDQVASDKRLLEAAFIANTQNDSMTELEQAEALRKLVAFYGSQTEAANRLGKSQGVISQRLSLLQLSPELQADLNEGRRGVEQVRGLASLTPEQQKAKADERAAQAQARAQNSRARRQRTPAPTPEMAMPRTPRPAAAPTDAGGQQPTSTAPPSAAAAPPAPGGGAVPQQTREQPPPQPPAVADNGQAPEESWTWSAAAEEEGRRLVGEFGFDDRRRIVMILLEANEREKAAATS